MTPSSGIKRLREDQISLPPIDLYGKQTVEKIVKKHKIANTAKGLHADKIAKGPHAEISSQSDIFLLPTEMFYHIFSFFDLKTNNCAKEACKIFLAVAKRFQTTLKDYLLQRAIFNACQLPEQRKTKALGKIFRSLIKINDLKAAQAVLVQLPEGAKRNKALCMMAYLKAKNSEANEKELLLKEVDATDNKILYTKITYLLKIANLYVLKNQSTFFAILHEIKRCLPAENSMLDDYLVILKPILDKLDKETIVKVLAILEISEHPYFTSFMIEKDAESNIERAESQVESDFQGKTQLEAFGIIAARQADVTPERICETVQKALSLRKTLQLDGSEKAGFYHDMAYALLPLGAKAELSFLQQIVDPEDLFTAHLAFANQYLNVNAEKAFYYIDSAYKVYNSNKELLAPFLCLVLNKLSRISHHKPAGELFEFLLKNASFKLNELVWDLPVSSEKTGVLIEAVDKAKKLQLQDFTENEREEIAIEQIAKFDPVLAVKRAKELTFESEPNFFGKIILSLANKNMGQALKMVEQFLPDHPDSEKNNEALFQRVLIYASLLAKCREVRDSF